MIIYLLSFIFRTLLWEKLRVLEFGYANPPDWSSPVIIIAWFLEFLILFFLVRRYRTKNRPALLSCRIRIDLCTCSYLALDAFSTRLMNGQMVDFRKARQI